MTLDIAIVLTLIVGLSAFAAYRAYVWVGKAARANRSYYIPLVICCFMLSVIQSAGRALFSYYIGQ